MAVEGSARYTDAGGAIRKVLITLDLPNNKLTVDCDDRNALTFVHAAIVKYFGPLILQHQASHQSALYCGCDPGENYKCGQHREP